MRVFAVCDNSNRCMGLRLAGIECIFLESVEDLAEILNSIDKEEIGLIIVMAELTRPQDLELLENFRIENTMPLLLHC